MPIKKVMLSHDADAKSSNDKNEKTKKEINPKSNKHLLKQKDNSHPNAEERKDEPATKPIDHVEEEEKYYEDGQSDQPPQENLERIREVRAIS